MQRIANHCFAKPLTTDRVAELLYKYSPHLIKKTYSDPSMFDDLVRIKEYMFDSSSSLLSSQSQEERKPNTQDSNAASVDDDEKERLNNKEGPAAN